MLCVTLILIAIINCGAREVPTSSSPEEFSISAVSLSTAHSGGGSRIIGGSPTSITNFPYAVQVLYNSQLTCGGSLLTARHVLSAAHCFVTQATGTPVGPALYSIRAGSTNLNQGGSVRSVSAIIIHESYSHMTHDNDVAVLVLSSAVPLSNSVQKGSIPLQGETLADNSTVTIVGWGRPSATLEGVSSVLLKVSVRTINRAVCRLRYEYLGNFTNSYLPVTENMICAGLLDVGGADSCQGDSGGPLIYNGIILGITSWGFRCADPSFPGVYAKVSRYTTWINQTVRKYQGNGSLRSQAGVLAVLIPLIFLMISV